MNTQHLTRSSWTRVRQLVNARDGETCQYCGEQAPDGDVDHILPLSKGGRDSLDNLVWSCQRCNREKSDKTLYEWLKSYRYKFHTVIETHAGRIVYEFDNKQDKMDFDIRVEQILAIRYKGWERIDACTDILDVGLDRVVEEYGLNETSRILGEGIGVIEVSETKLDDAKKWLLDVMEQVERIPAKEVERLASEFGYSWAMTNEAKRELTWDDNGILIQSERNKARWDWVVYPGVIDMETGEMQRGVVKGDREGTSI